MPVAKDTARKDPLRFVKAALRAVMTARSINFTYTRSNGTLLPGYLPNTRFFGLTDNGSGSFRNLAPGIPFILGQQYSSITELDQLHTLAVNNGWYTTQSQYLNTPLSSLLTENITARTTLEPFRGFNVQLDARWQRTKNQEAYYRNAIDTSFATYTSLGELVPYADSHLAPVQAIGTGSFSTTTITIQTHFGDLGANGETSKAFDRFVENRQFVQQKLQAAAPTTNGVSTGLYSYNSQEVLIQSFLDAYHGKSSSGYEAKNFNPFGMIPLPNWRLDYNSFADLPGMRDLFRTFTITHAYTSVYTLGSYTTATNYTDQTTGNPNSGKPYEPDIFNSSLPYLRNSTGQYVPYYVVGQVSILESLTPLLGINFQTVNNVTGRLSYSTSRAVALNTTNAQVTELRTADITIGLGYAATGLKLPFKVGGEQRVLKNNLQARLDLNIRDNTTIQRSILGSIDPT
ncbi:MAG: cell surface protein SprA, partial [Hymenobacter sp.]